MTKEELKTILELHAKWLLGSADGKRANLSYADLSYANLSYANLRNANLRNANLRNANLRYANLRNADLSYADLSYANLRNADLSYADLSYANLRNADLSYADLSYANLRNANLRNANLRDARDDFFEVLDLAKAEVPGLYKALVDGRVNGSQYEGECACLVGTIANVRGKPYKNLGLLAPNSARPSERWFLAIEKGDTPENSQVSAITVEWLKEFAKKHEITLPERKIVWSE